MPNEGLHLLDYLVVLLYLAVIVCIGLYISRKQKTTDAYFAGGRSIPAWAVGLSLLATLISTVTFLAYPGDALVVNNKEESVVNTSEGLVVDPNEGLIIGTGEALMADPNEVLIVNPGLKFSGNWIRLVQGLMVPLVLVIIIWFVVPMYRQIIGISAYEYFEKRFGYFARLYSSLAFVMAHFTKMGSVFYLLAKALETMTDINMYYIILVLGVITILYTLIGGIEAVIWSDVIQGIILVGGGLICVGVLLLKPVQGPETIVKTAWESGKMSVGPYDWSFTKLTFWVMAINGIFYAIQKYGMDQTIVQRFLVAKSNAKAIKAALMGALLCVPVWTLFMFIGTLLWYFYSNAGFSPEGHSGDEVFPYFIKSQLPAGVTGLILAALISAAMSSLDSDLNCLAAVGVEDYYRRLKKDATDKQCLNMGKIIVTVCGLCAIGIACLYVLLGGEAILGTIFGLYAIFSGGIVGLFALGFFTVRTNRKGVYIGIAACVLFTAYAVLTSIKFDLGGKEQQILDLGRFNFTHHKYMLGVYSHIILFVVGYLASFFFRPDKDIKDFTLYGWLTKRKDLSVAGE